MDLNSIDFYQDISQLPITPQDIEYLRRSNNIYQTEVSTLLSIDSAPSQPKNWNESDLADEIEAIGQLEKEYSSSRLKVGR